MTTGTIIIHNQHDFDAMNKAGQIAAACLDMIAQHIQIGITTDQLDRLCHQFLLDHDSIPAPLGYKGYPRSICTSINHVVCHGIPGARALRNGDIINIDVTAIFQGWHGDTSRMFCVGTVSKRAQKLVEITWQALERAIAIVRPGQHVGDIGHAIQSHVEKKGFSVVRDFCGHGLGRVFHQPPEILHFGTNGSGPRLEAGMFFTIEPMINAGRKETRIKKDGWTAVTKDLSLSAQFEHSIGVTENGCKVFTRSPKGYEYPPYTS